jgi:WD40 repeat protein
MSEINQPVPTCLLARFPDIKVHHMDLHPVKPWILFATKAGQVYLYDYAQNDVLHSFSLNSMYDSKREEAQLLKVLEKNYNNVSLPDWYDDNLLQAQKLGDLKTIRLYDEDIVHWKLNEKEHDTNTIINTVHNTQFEKVGRHLNLAGSNDNNLKMDLGGSSKQSKTYVPSRRPKCVVLQTETRVIMMRYDEVSSSLYFFDEVKHTQLDNKNITCMEFLYTHPIIALGCSDGSIRLWNYKTKEILKKIILSTAKVTKLIAVPVSDQIVLYCSI